MGMVKAIVIRTAGTNCDGEMVRGFTQAGASVELVHLDRLCEQPTKLDGFDLIGFPGGFSYGDDIASGRIFAMRVRERLWGSLRKAIDRGVPMIGACNGFQTMVQVGLLPGATGAWPDAAPPEQTVALTDNIGARFVDRWVGIALESESPCLWTRGLSELAQEIDAMALPGLASSDVMMLPTAHGEGRLVAANEGVLDAMESGGQVALRYTDNYNGSQRAIAGICDASGRIFGLMPHPERYLDWTRHPYWTRLPERVKAFETPGLRMFKNAVEAAKSVGV